MDAKVMQAMLAWRPASLAGEAAEEGAAEEGAEESVTIAAGRTADRELLVGPGDTVRWKFCVLGAGDVDFSVVAFLPTSAAGGGGGDDEGSGGGAEGGGTARTAREDARESILVARRRHAAGEGEVSGSCTLPRVEGTDEAASCLVLARWSNAHSWMRSKSLRLELTVELADTAELDVEGASGATAQAAAAAPAPAPAGLGGDAEPAPAGPAQPAMEAPILFAKFV